MIGDWLIIQKLLSLLVPLVGITCMLGWGLYTVYQGAGRWQRKRLVEATPTKPVRSVRAGRAELTGTGRPVDEPATRPFGNEDCLVATYEIEEYKQKLTQRTASWHTVESGLLAEPFELDDGTGAIRVEPDEDVTLDASEAHTETIQVDHDETEPPELVEFLETHTETIQVDHDETEPPELAEFLEAHTDRGVPSKDESPIFPDNDRRYRQQWLPLGAATFAVGAVERSRGERVLRRDTDSDVFLVSDKSESELTDDIGRSALKKIGLGLLMTVSMLAMLGFYVVGWLFL